MWIVITNSLDNTVRRLNRQTLNHCFTNTHYLAFRIPMPKTHLPRNKISPCSHRILRKKSRPKSKVNETGWKMNERKKRMKMHETRWWNACTVSPPRESTSGAQHSSYVISQPPCSKCILSILLLLSINISHQATNPSIISMSLFVICTLHPKNLPNCQHQ